MKKSLRISYCFLLVGLLLAACSETRNLAEGELLYTGIKRIDYAPFQAMLDSGEGRADSLRALQQSDKQAYAEAKTEVEAALAKSPNNSLMGSSFYRFPLPMGLWLYNRHVFRTSKYSRWMMNTFAATPVYLTTVNPQVRARVAQNTLRNFGYFRASVSYDTIPQRNPKKTKVSYTVNPGELFRLDTIAYQYFSHQTDSLVRRSMRASLLRQGQPFSVKKLDAERTRLSNLFRDNGYYFYQPQYITFRADTLMREQHVQLQVRPDPNTPHEARWQFPLGRTRINLYRYDDRQLTDSFTVGSTTLAHSGKPKRPPLRLRSMRRLMFYREGDLYNQSRMALVQELLSGMGVFSGLSIDYALRDSLRGQGLDTLDVIIHARLDRPYDTEFRGSIANKSNGLLGPGVSYSITRSNAFRGAEKLTLELHGSYEWMLGQRGQGSSQQVNSYEYGADLSLQLPRIALLGLFPKINHRAQTTTNYKLSATWLNRSGYYGQVVFGGRISYTYRRRYAVWHEITPFRLDYNMLLHTTDKYRDIITQTPALEVSMRDQFVPSMGYTLNMTSRKNARNPRTFTLDIKEAGNITSLGYRLWGEDWRKSGKGLFNVPFAQYFKVTAQVTEKYKIRQTRTYLVGRIFAGAVVSYGNSTMAPYTDLFSIGGANSIRAFSSRSIGPGSYHPSSSRYSYINQVGDLKFEANAEYRFPLIGSLEGAFFLDAGNVWLLKPDASRPGGSFNLSTFGKELALGTGFGFRYDLDFLVVRFDIGIGLHAPYDTGKSGYYNLPKFWDSLGYHIAVGYPF